MWPLAALDFWGEFHWLHQDSGGSSPSKTEIPEAVDGTGAYWVVLLAAPVRLVEWSQLWTPGAFCGTSLEIREVEPVQLVELPYDQWNF